MAARCVRRVVELYSGVGGMHYALEASHLEASMVAAVDINDLANKIYQHNFPDVNLMQRNIQSLTQAEFTGFDSDMFVMSPPCQPFTRVGLKGDCNDPRTQSFIHLLDLLPKLSKLPSYILVENVKGFETSNTRSLLIQTLQQCSYDYQEFLLSPSHFSIPNQRLRYFMVAKHRPLVFKSTNISDEEHRVLQQQRILEDPHCHEDQNVTDVAPENTFGRSDVVVKNIVASSCSCCKDDRNLSVVRCSQRLGDVMISDQGTSSSCQIVNRTTCHQSTSHPTEANSKSKSDLSHFRNSSPLIDIQSNETVDLDGGAKEEASKIDTEDNHQTLRGDYHNRIQGEIGSVDPQQLVTEHEGRDPGVPHQRLVGDYLESLSVEEEERFLLQDKLLMRFARIIDVVTSQDCNTRCFTKAYGHYIEGTGSMLQMNSSLKGTTLLKNCSQDVKMISADYLKDLKYLRLRYFTPREIANLHHFPKTFEFPDGLSRKQEYRVLGNSLNVHVVSVLLHFMVTETDSLKA